MPKLKYEDLVSERLVLRLPIHEDYGYQYEYLSNPLNYPYADYKIAESEADISNFFDKMFKEHLSNSLFWMITDKSTNKPMGSLSAWNINWEENTIEFGYSLYPEYRGHGYMKEAIETVIKFLNEENNLFVFEIWTDCENIPSVNLVESLGFSFQGNEVEKAHNSDRNITYSTYRLDLRKPRNYSNLEHEEIDYLNFGKCLKITSPKAEVIVTLDVGPRIISYRLLDGENIFWEDIERISYLNNQDIDKMFFKGATWYGLGGHRLWSSPESFSTYYPDNNPVEYKLKNGVFTFLQEKQIYNEVQLTLTVSFLNETEIIFEGTITNKSKIAKTCSSWSLSMCKGPGLEIVKLPINDTGFKPQRVYSLWNFGAKNNDPRAYYGENYFALRMEPGNKKAYKVGMRINAGKVLYLTGKNAYIKKFNLAENQLYPDNNVNYETYTKDLFMELETLSPLKTIKPNESVTQKEVWNLVKLEDNIPKDFNEEELRRLFIKYTYNDGEDNQ